MPDCSNHKKEVAGISDMKVLAEMVGDLHYETISRFLYELSDKIYEDGRRAFLNGRYQLSSKLLESSGHLKNCFKEIKAAWEISKPFMEENQSQS